MTATYAVVKNSAGTEFFVSNAVKNSAGTIFNVTANAKNSAGSEFVIFKPSLPLRPMGEVFVVTKSRTFIA